jgi:uncharacterized protein YciI
MSEIGEFLYRIQVTRDEMLTQGPTPREEDLVGQHFEFLKGLLERGQLVLAGRTQNTDPTSFGIVIFRADSKEAARQLMESDPAVAGGVMHAELFPYRVALIESSR